MRHPRAALVRLAAGLALAVLLLTVAVQAIVSLAVRDVTDDYVRRFMAGTVELLREDLAALPPPSRAQRVRELDERFAYPLALADSQDFDARGREQLAAGQMLVYGLNRRVAVALPAAGARSSGMQVLVVGPLDPDWNPEHRLNLPRELWLQGAVALLLAAGAGALAWTLLRPAWRDVRALQRAGEALGSGRFDTPLPVLGSVLLRPLGEGLRTTLERLAAALAAQRELTGAVSHELRTPLARLRFALDALVEESDAHARERAVQACERDIEELEALIDASLLLAKLDMGAVRAVCSSGDLAALLQREASSLAPLLEGRELETVIELPAQVPFDARLIPYAVRNGLRNAARHANRRIVLSAWIEGGTAAVAAPGSAQVSAQRPALGPALGPAAAPRVCVAIDDDGAGVPEALREAVFQPFRRLQGERERRSTGYGLGLAIVRRVAQAHGGQATMQSAPLGGARLLIAWPAHMA
jgi:two-component system sensor histidine kinase RstB